MKRVLSVGIALAAAGLLAGCGSMSGLDASSSFSCKAAPGVICQSISGVHQNASAGSLPFQRSGETQGVNNDQQSKDDKKPAYGATKAEGKVSPRDMNAAYSGMPVRQPATTARASSLDGALRG